VRSTDPRQGILFHHTPERFRVHCQLKQKELNAIYSGINWESEKTRIDVCRSGINCGRTISLLREAAETKRKVVLMLKRLILMTLLGLISIPVVAQVKLTGTVSEWYGGTPAQSPKKHALLGVTVVAGTDLDLKTGQAGADQIKGKVAAKAVTDEKGNYTLNLPAGKYTVVYWKSGYTPQVDSGVSAPGVHDAEISSDKSMHGLHRSVEFPH
jgi:hypothetical protein